MPFGMKRKKKRIRTKENPKMEVVLPSIYKKPVPEFLTIFDDFGNKKVLVKRISAEEIKLPNGDILYTGVPAQPSAYRIPGWKAQFKDFLAKMIPGYGFNAWNIVSMNYSFTGQPFTFYPKTMQIITNEKKRSVLIDQRVCIPVNISANKTVYVLVSKITGNPIWKEGKIPEELKKEVFGEDLKKTSPETKIEKQIPINTFYKYIDDKKDALKDLEYIDLPFKTDYDVTEMEMVRNEWGQIIYGNAMKVYAKVQDEIGDKGESMILLLAGMIMMFLTMCIFLYAGSEGVFR
jgi:hypothetical protein